MRNRVSGVVVLLVVVQMVGARGLPAKISACKSEVYGPEIPRSVMVCPAGDGQTLAQADAVITVITRDFLGNPIFPVHAMDYWLESSDGGANLCRGSYSTNADHNSDQNGSTTLSGTIAAGGSAAATLVVVMGEYVLMCPSDCGCAPAGISVAWVSPDINGDMVVNLTDLSLFGRVFSSGIQGYDPAMDFNADGAVDVLDLSVLAAHWQHQC